jgi:hypothetical protein
MAIMKTGNVEMMTAEVHGASRMSFSRLDVCLVRCGAVTFDCADALATCRFWAAVLGSNIDDGLMKPVHERTVGEPRAGAFGHPQRQKPCERRAAPKRPRSHGMGWSEVGI